MNKNALDRLAQRIGALETRRGNGGRSYMMTAAGPWWNAEAIAAQAEQYRAARGLVERDRVIVRTILPHVQRQGETGGRCLQA